jgi:formylmethanofuran dehydrogenase subunit C
VSDIVTLSLRSPVDQHIEVEGLTGDVLGGRSERDIAALRVWAGGRAAQLGDFFDVRGERTSRVHLEGNLARVDGMGAGMIDGELVIDGDVGRRVGAKMSGGTITVRGNAGDEAGLAMSGGVLHISGRAGDRVGAAVPGAARGMTGGEIVVAGSVGGEAAARARRGLVVVGGDAGTGAGRSMIAGTLVVLGRTGREPGRNSKRGSIVSVGGIDVPSTYQYACTFEPPHVRLTLTYVRRRYELPIDDAAINGRYRRYCGDAGDPGRGEILAFDDGKLYT